MAKISPYSLGNISVDLEQFRDETTNIINLGKVAPAVVTTAPSWNAQPGEMVWLFPASGGTTLYFYRNSAWVSLVSISV